MSGFVGIVSRSVTLATVRFAGGPELEALLVNRRPHPDTPRAIGNRSKMPHRKPTERSQASDSSEHLVGENFALRFFGRKVSPRGAAGSGTILRARTPAGCPTDGKKHKQTCTFESRLFSGVRDLSIRPPFKCYKSLYCSKATF